MTETVLSSAKSAKPWALINLPPLPSVATRLLQLVDSDEVGIKRLTDLIRADMALSTEVLTLANSALFAFRTEIKSVLQAAVLLGLRRVSALVVT